MKRMMSWILALMLVCTLTMNAFAGEEAKPSVPAESIRADVVDLKMELNPQTGFTVIIVNTQFTNDAPVGVMEIRYQLTVVDAEGKEVSRVSERFNGLDTPIAPGQTATRETGWQERLEGTLHHVEVTVQEVFSETDLPPVHLPQPGEALYLALGNESLARLNDELPVALTMWIDRGGAEEITRLTDEALIREAVARFMEVKIAEETYEWVTDNYNGICFTFADGTECVISLNLKNLEFSAYRELKLYELEDLKPFWEFMSSYAAAEAEE